MKKYWIISTLFLIGASIPLYAQVWSGSLSSDFTTHSGNVGIGTTATNAKLNIEGNGDWTMRLKDINGGTDWFVGSSGSVYGVGAGRLVFSPTSSSVNTVLTLTNYGRVGVGNGNYGPRAVLDVGYPQTAGILSSAFGRLSEGNSSGEGTYLGARAYSTSAINIKSFALEHGFYGNINSSINFYRGADVTGGYITFATNTNAERMWILNNGNVCIGGQFTVGYKLAVDGTIGAREVNVNSNNWADYVFDKDYKLLPLTEVEKYIKANHHLPEVPSTEEVEANGINVGEMNALLLKKIEELTLHIIDLEKRIKKAGL